MKNDINFECVHIVEQALAECISHHGKRNMIAWCGPQEHRHLDSYVPGYCVDYSRS